VGDGDDDQDDAEPELVARPPAKPKRARSPAGVGIALGCSAVGDDARAG
jgi:hypothetical protein